MNYPLQAMIAMGAVPSVSFPADSRYYGSKTLQYVAPDGTMISYLARRFVPLGEGRPSTDEIVALLRSRTEWKRTPA